MKVFHFNGHDVPRADIINARITCSYADLTLFVDLELEGGATISLNQDDSLLFMDDVMEQIRQRQASN